MGAVKEGPIVQTSKKRALSISEQAKSSISSALQLENTDQKEGGPHVVRDTPRLIRSWLERLPSFPDEFEYIIQPPFKRARSQPSRINAFKKSDSVPKTPRVTMSGNNGRGVVIAVPAARRESSVRSRLGSSQSPQSSSASSATNASNASRRSAIRMSDLLFAAKPIVELDLSNCPTDVANLHKQLMDINARVQFLPGEIVTEIKATIAAEKKDRVYDHMFTQRPAPTTPDADTTVGATDPCNPPLDELRAVRAIVAASTDCRLHGYAEPHWNGEVHHPLLRLAFRAHPLIRHVNAAKARPQRALLPRYRGVPLRAKMVDFVLVLEVDQARVVECLNREVGGEFARSVNVTDQAGLQTRPVAVSIETKKVAGKGGDERVQLAVWVAGQFNRLRVLMRRDGDGVAGDDKQLAKRVTVTLPLISVVGDQWNLHFAVDAEKEMNILGVVPLGCTNTITGCYQILAALRCVGQWMCDVYRPWFLENILQDEAEDAKPAEA